MTNLNATNYGQAMKLSDWTHDVQVELAEANGNTTGIFPIGFTCLILPDPVEAVTKGGVHLPDEKVTKDEYATTAGTIIDVSPAAFSHITDAEWAGTKPKAGDHVIHTKYAGFRHKGKDGKDYLIVKDQDIHARIE